MNQYAIYLLAWLTYHGYPLVQRDTVYYAAKAESGIRSDAVSRYGNVGLFQLNGSRKYAMVAYARAKKKPWTSMEIQLEFMDWEWRRMPASKAFFATTDRGVAWQLFCRHYEGSVC